MAGNSWFRRHSQALAKAEQVPEGLWTKCPACSAILFMPELERNLRVCGKCGYHYRLGWKERLVITADEGSFEGLDSDLRSADPLDFPDYQQKLAKGRAATGLEDGFVTGTAAIGGQPTVLGIADFSFMGGSMGALVGFAGQRVAAQAQVVKVPDNFQRAEFQIEHGMVDMIVPRRDMRDTLARILRFATAEVPGV